MTVRPRAVPVFVVRLLLAALGLWLASEIASGVRFDAALDLVAAAVLLGVVNALVRPVLVLLTLPFTVLSLGLFLLAVNAATVGLTAYLLPGFHLNGFWPALAAAVITGAVSWAANAMVKPD